MGALATLLNPGILPAPVQSVKGRLSLVRMQRTWAPYDLSPLPLDCFSIWR